jgi:hypothetical protein
MNDFKERLRVELEELQEKAGKLSAFIMSDAFMAVDPIQKSLLEVQYQSMITYATCLQQRITNL